MISLVEIGTLVQEKMISKLISSMYFGYLIIISPRKRTWLHFNKLESPSPKEDLYQIWFNG